MKILLLTAAATVTAAFTAPAANADYHTENLIRQSHRIEAYAKSLRSEFQIHFRHTASYGHLMSDTYSIAKRADAIHGMAHHIHCSGDLHRLEAELGRLDSLVHHLGDLVSRASHGHGGGHVHGDTRHVRGLVFQMNNSIHSMEASARALEARYHHPVHPGHGHGHDDLGARIIGGVLREVIGGGGHAGHGH